jgi:hypothetical protein
MGFYSGSIKRWTMPVNRFNVLRIALTVSILVIAMLSACNFPGISGDETESTSEAEVELTEFAQTVEAEGTLAAQTVVAGVTLTTQANVGADEPTATIPIEVSPTLPIVTPLLSSTPEPSPTLGQPIIYANVDTNCRMGPSTLYPVVGYLLVGQESIVHGRNSDSTWWYIETPKKPGTYCWAWGGSTRVEGDTRSLPVITPPPPPTLTPTTGAISIHATFSNVHSCAGSPTAIFQITNIGSLPIESVSLIIKNLNTNTVVYSQGSNNPFFGGPGGCPPGSSALAPGATGYVGGTIGIIPAGTNMSVEARLCSGDNLSGSCLVYNFNWSQP